VAEKNNNEDFKYLTTDLWSLRFVGAERIAEMARDMLRTAEPQCTTDDEARAIANTSLALIENFFSEERYSVGEKIKSDERWDLVETDEDGMILYIKSEAADEYDWSNEENTTETSALNFAIEQQGPALDYPTFKYFAALAMFNIEGWWRRYHFEYHKDTKTYQKRRSSFTDNDYAVMNNYLVDGMEAVCEAKHLMIERWRDEHEKKRKKALDEAEKTKRAEQQKVLNQKRWKQTNEIREWVCEDWKLRRSDFISAPAAADYYVDQIPERFLSIDAVPKRSKITNWIRACARSIGVSLR
jgi:hypothetical protein